MTQMVNYVEKVAGLLSQTRSGFRKGHCTVITCIKIKNDIIKAMDRGEVTLAVMTDCSKAFDTVDFEILIQKLLPLLKKLKAYLSKLSVSSSPIRFCVNKTTSYQWSASRKHPRTCSV